MNAGTSDDGMSWNFLFRLQRYQHVLSLSSSFGFFGRPERAASAPDAFHSTIEAAEESAPCSSSTIKDRSWRFERDDSIDASFAYGELMLDAQHIEKAIRSYCEVPEPP